jgi:hypothetical protein
MAFNIGRNSIIFKVQSSLVVNFVSAQISVQLSAKILFFLTECQDLLFAENNS